MELVTTYLLPILPTVSPCFFYWFRSWPQCWPKRRFGGSGGRF